MTDRKTARRIVQLEATAEEDRSELEALLGEIRYQLQPKVQAQILLAEARDKTLEVTEKAEATLAKALSGDREAIVTVLKVLAIGTATGAFIGWRIHAHTGKRRLERQWRSFTRQLGKTYPPQDIEFTVR